MRERKIESQCEEEIHKLKVGVRETERHFKAEVRETNLKWVSEIERGKLEKGVRVRQIESGCKRERVREKLIVKELPMVPSRQKFHDYLQHFPFRNRGYQTKAVIL